MLGFVTCYDRDGHFHWCLFVIRDRAGLNKLRWLFLVDKLWRLIVVDIHVGGGASQSWGLGCKEVEQRNDGYLQYQEPAKYLLILLCLRFSTFLSYREARQQQLIVNMWLCGYNFVLDFGHLHYLVGRIHITYCMYIHTYYCSY